jgi:NAD(P)-dependent dehydrogenase (short-subunit alcohol dehydrogenase family)
MTTTVITGATKGLGFETARRLVAAGHTVYVGARSKDKAQQAADRLGARPLLIDITDDESVRAAADEVARAHDALDVLVNNAGISAATQAPEEVTGPDLAAMLDTNTVGVVRVMHAFLPLLRRAEHGVVVNVGSGLGSLSRATDPAAMESRWLALGYATTKAAVSMLTVQYAKAFPELRINVVDPGYTATDLNGFRGTQTVEQGVGPIVRAATITADGPTGGFFDAAGVVPW